MSVLSHRFFRCPSCLPDSEAFKSIPEKPAGMSQATKIVLGTIAVAGALALALVVAAVL